MSYRSGTSRPRLPLVGRSPPCATATRSRTPWSAAPWTCTCRRRSSPAGCLTGGRRRCLGNTARAYSGDTCVTSAPPARARCYLERCAIMGLGCSRWVATVGRAPYTTVTFRCTAISMHARNLRSHTVAHNLQSANKVLAAKPFAKPSFGGQTRRQKTRAKRHDD